MVLPEGFKAQVVATSRQAAVMCYEKLAAAKDALIAELEALPDATISLFEGEIDALDAETTLL